MFDLLLIIIKLLLLDLHRLVNLDFVVLILIQHLLALVASGLRALSRRLIVSSSGSTLSAALGGRRRLAAVVLLGGGGNRDA